MPSTAISPRNTPSTVHTRPSFAFSTRRATCLKVPRPWPDRQDEAVREAFLTHLRTLAEDPGIEFWYGDETGIDGEPRPRRKWAMKGSRPKVVHNGDHIRLSILGTVCPRTGDFFAIEASHCDTDVF